MKSSRTGNFIGAAVLIALGILCIFLKAEMISIALTVAGALLIVYGVLDLIRNQIVPGIVKLVCGVAVIILGWLVVTVVLYIAAVLIILYGFLVFLEAWQNVSGKTVDLAFCIAAVRAIVDIVVGFLLLFNQGGTVEWVFIVSGILLLADGAVLLLSGILGKG